MKKNNDHSSFTHSVDLSHFATELFLPDYIIRTLHCSILHYSIWKVFLTFVEDGIIINIQKVIIFQSIHYCIKIITDSDLVIKNNTFFYLNEMKIMFLMGVHKIQNSNKLGAHNEFPDPLHH